MWTLVPEFAISTRRDKRIIADGTLVDDFRLTYGSWETENIADDLAEDSEYILRLIGNVINVSLEKMAIVVGLPVLRLDVEEERAVGGLEVA